MDEAGVKVKKPRNNNVSFMRQCFITLAVCSNVTAHGCVIGFSAILIPSLRLPESRIITDASSESWIASIIGCALIVGNIIITPLMDSWGRQKSHLLTTVPILTGWFLLLMVNSVPGIITARFLQGISMGLLGPLGSIIIGEMTNPKNRGAFLTMVSLSLTIGVLFVQTLGTFLSWQQTALACSFITFSSMIMIMFTPESPCWLAAQGRYDECRDVFRWLRGEDDPEQEDELEKLILAQKITRKMSITEVSLPLKERMRKRWRYFAGTVKKKEFFKPIVIMFHIYTMFQFAGINVISSYTTDIIRQVVGTDTNVKLWMVVLGVERLVCNILAVFVMRLVKRRTVLFSTGAICIASYLGQAAYVYARENNQLPFDNNWVPITLIGVYMFSLSLGISSVPFTVSGEIFPLAYRGLGGGISVLALSLNFFIAVKCFPVLNHKIGLPITYCLYAAVVLYCLVVAFFLLPETKDRTLQEIEDSFRGRPSNTGDKNLMEPLRDGVDVCDNETVRNAAMRRRSSQIIY